MPIYSALRPLLFCCDPERAHGLALGALRLAQLAPGVLPLLARRQVVAHPALAQQLLGREFPNPVGLAAGFDKDAAAVPALAALGFGFVEVGTVTPRPQAGNPRPRLFRHAAARSLQNSLGFNNRGAEAMRRRLLHLAGERARWPRDRRVPVGVNLGKGRDTPAAAALDDYRALAAGLGDLADYLVVNLSSPNTPGLRDLQQESFVREVLRATAAVTRTPVLVKLSPDLEAETAAALAAVAADAGAAGIVATNTSTDYALLPGARAAGGLSGQVLQGKSRRALAAIGRRLGRGPGSAGRAGGPVLISVGGVDSAAEAYARLRAGASLVQLYTALVYEGPSLPGRINRELLALLARDGLSHIGQAIGADL